jgi:hypothetical protein
MVGWLGTTIGYSLITIDSLVIVIPCVGLNVKYPLTSGVSHHGLAIYIKKCLKAKEELWKLKYFTMQKYNLPKILYKGTKILQHIITL